MAATYDAVQDHRSTAQARNSSFGVESIETKQKPKPVIKYVAIGGSLAFAAAVQPGPFQAFLLSLVTAIGWRRDDSRGPEQVEKAPKTLFEAALVNLLNPNPYLGWTLVLGPIVLAVWQDAPSAGVAVVVAFYATMVVTLAGLIVLFGSARLLGTRLQRALMFVSVRILAGLDLYQLARGVQYFGLPT